MIYKLDMDFSKIEQTDGLMQNLSSQSYIEVVTCKEDPRKDSGIILMPLEKLQFRTKRGESVFARSAHVGGTHANLSIVNFNVPVPEYGTGVGSISYGHVVLNGYIKADGALILRNEYPALFEYASQNGLILNEIDWNNHMRGMYGEGDGSTTFRVPDLRGYFLRALDDEAGIDSDRDLGSAQEDAIRNIVGEIKSTNNGPNYIFLGDSLASGGALEVVNAGSKYAILSNTNLQFGCDAFTFDASRAVPTAKENRPKNIALIAQIKY